MIDFFKKIWAWIISVPQDKLLHFIAGLLITIFSFGIAYIFTNFWPAFGIANLIAVIFFVAKELYDAFHPEGHSVEWKDLVADAAGLVVADLALLLICFAMIV